LATALGKAPGDQTGGDLMRRTRWFGMFVVVASVIFSAFSVQAADDEGSSLYKLFENLMRLYDQGSLQARKVYVRNQLIRLNQQLWKYEQDKRYLVLSLQRSQPDWDEISSAESDLYQRISILSATLDQFGAEMRTYDISEDPAGQLGAVLILKRAVWLSKVGDVARRRDAGQLSEVAKEGSDALRQLTEANKSLSRLIAKLE
jgi:hypothetical protein